MGPIRKKDGTSTAASAAVSVRAVAPIPTGGHLGQLLDVMRREGGGLGLTSRSLLHSHAKKTPSSAARHPSDSTARIASCSWLVWPPMVKKRGREEAQEVKQVVAQ